MNFEKRIENLKKKKLSKEKFYKKYMNLLFKKENFLKKKKQKEELANWKFTYKKHRKKYGKKITGTFNNYIEKNYDSEYYYY